MNDEGGGVTTYLIQGRTIELPLRIADATGGLGIFAADADRIAERLPEGLAPLRLPGGRGVVVVMLVDYRDNPLGAYDEGVVGFGAQPVEASGEDASLVSLIRGRAGMWVEHMPVSRAFTREAGETIWGYPKTLDELRITRSGKQASLEWGRAGERILHLEVTTGGLLPLPRVPGLTFTQKDGVVQRTRLRAKARRMRFGPGGARLEIGDHPVGRELRELSLGETAIASVWLEGASLVFDAAQRAR